MITKMIAPEMCHNKCAGGWKQSTLDAVVSHYKCTDEETKRTKNIVESSKTGEEESTAGQLSGGMSSALVNAVVVGAAVLVATMLQVV
jgi:Na+/H+-translocating membrane pyrophosphatase